MGWSSANPIFDRTIKEVIANSIRGDALESIAYVLIDVLQDGDWDTENESVELFEDYPEILNAFRESGVRIPCNCQCCDHEGDR